MDKLLSIVIVEYHSVEEINKCIDSIDASINVPYEILVSSNSCYDEATRNTITPRNSKVRWLFNARNGGFAYAMNCGLREAKGDYLVIMNSDCIITSDLGLMVGFMERHPEVGAMGPQIKDNVGNIQDTARPYVSLPRLFLRHLRRVAQRQSSVLENRMDYETVQTVDWVIGAFIMVSRKAYSLTHGLDDRYFMYAEDLDWCTRIRKEKLEVVYFPPVVVTYKGTRRARKNKKYAAIFVRSHLHYWRKFGFFNGYPPRRRMTY